MLLVTLTIEHSFRLHAQDDVDIYVSQFTYEYLASTPYLYKNSAVHTGSGSKISGLIIILLQCRQKTEVDWTDRVTDLRIAVTYNQQSNTTQFRYISTILFRFHQLYRIFTRRV